jgi:hypothetical protein
MKHPEIHITTVHPRFWRSYKAIRLEALRNDPEAFCETLEKSLSQPDQFWIDRVTNSYLQKNV